MALPFQLRLLKVCPAKLAYFNYVTMASWSSQQAAIRLQCSNLLNKAPTHKMTVTDRALWKRTVCSHYQDMQTKSVLTFNRSMGLRDCNSLTIMHSLRSAQSGISAVAANGRMFHTQVLLLAGHNKWSNIKHIKGAKDAARSLMVSKYSKLIRTVVKESGPNPATNSKLASLMEKAAAQDMPKLSIENAIKSANKVGTEVTNLYEVKGPGGCSLLVEMVSDKPKNAKHELTKILKKSGFSIGASGSLMYAFEHKGVVRINPDMSTDQPNLNLDLATEVAIEVGAEDVQEDVNMENEANFMFICNQSDVKTVKEELALSYTIESSGLEYVPMLDYLVELSETNLEKASEILRSIEEHPDVAKVYDNIIAA